MYDIIKVGIPLQDKDITQQFLNIIKEIQDSDDCIALTTVDYWQGEIDYAPGGNYVLLKNVEFKPYTDTIYKNCINTMGSIWGGVRDLPTMVKKLLSILDDAHGKINFKKVYILAGGSPLCGDSITEYMLKLRPEMMIVDTPSCIEVAYSATNLTTEWVETDYVKFCIKDGIKFIPDTTKINIFLCLQKWYEYNNIHTLNVFFDDMKSYYSPDDICKIVNIKSDICDIQTLTFASAENMKEKIYNDHKAVVILLYKKDLK